MPELMGCLACPETDAVVAGMVLGPLAVTLIVPDHEKVHGSGIRHKEVRC